MFFPGLLFSRARGRDVAALAFAGRGRATAQESAADDQPTRHACAAPLRVWRFVEPLLWIALYIALAEWAGFLLTAGALLLLYLVRLGTRLSVALPLTLVLVPVAYYVFAVVLRVSLPRGILGW